IDENRHPAIPQPANPLQHRLGPSTEPDRDGALERAGRHVDLAQVMPLPLECHCWLSPQCSQDVHLLFDVGAARWELGVHRLELRLVPTDSQAQPQASPTENVKRCGLFRQQQRLPTGGDYDSCRQFELLSPARQESIEYQGLMPGILRIEAIE